MALVSFEGALAVRASSIAKDVEFLVQVHDSLVFQIKTNRVPFVLPLLNKLLHQPVPYPDPLVIPWGLAASTKSWGDVQDMPWPQLDNRPVG